MTRLPDFRLETYFSRWEFAARYHLTASDAQTTTLADLLSLADSDDLRAWEGMSFGYTETFGDGLLRQTIGDMYAVATADDIICFAGAEEGLFLAMQVLLSPGDHAIVITPNYQAAETVPLSLCEVTGVALDPTENWSLDLDLVAAEIRPNTKVISVNFPNNPTGKVLTHDDFARLGQLCDIHGIYLFSDEVYRGLESDRASTLAQACDISSRALSLNVMSKSFGLPGLRIGWIACRDPKVRSELERAKHYTTICNAGPSEILARIAIKARTVILERNRRIIDDNLIHFAAFFAEFDELFDWQPPDGGCVAFPRYLGPDGVERFCADLIDQAGVLLLPSSIYRSDLTATPTDRFRIGVGRRNPEAGLEAFSTWLRAR